MLYGTILPWNRKLYPNDCIMYPNALAKLYLRLDDLKDPNMQRIVETIDKNTVKIYPDGGVVMFSPVFGSISINDLSTGAKTLMLAYKGTDGSVKSDSMGDNCFPLLAELAQNKDIHIYISHKPFVDFPIYITNVNKLVENALDLCDTVSDVRSHMKGDFDDNYY